MPNKCQCKSDTTRLAKVRCWSFSRRKFVACTKITHIWCRSRSSKLDFGPSTCLSSERTSLSRDLCDSCSVGADISHVTHHLRSPVWGWGGRVTEWGGGKRGGGASVVYFWTYHSAHLWATSHVWTLFTRPERFAWMQRITVSKCGEVSIVLLAFSWARSSLWSYLLLFVWLVQWSFTL